MKKISHEKIMEFIKSRYCNGAFTEELSAHFRVSNRTVGHMMRPLIKSGEIIRYGRGIMVIAFSPGEAGIELFCNNSFYSLY